MERIILHCDLNNFFASVECVKHPEYRDRPLAVCGAVEERHGICLAKNELAKRFGIKTGDTVLTVRQKCPDIVIAQPHYEDYEQYSRLSSEIYGRFTDLIEPFGCDESWLDVTASTRLFGDGFSIANQIRETVKRELGLTISAGVSFNKIFAKLGSDMKKPDAVSCIPKETFREQLRDLPAADLLGVGPATAQVLRRHCIHTVGQLSAMPPQYLVSWLGKSGMTLWRYANGLDDAPVIPRALASPIQSVSRGMTPLRDIRNAAECAALLRELSEDIGRRLRRKGLRARGIRISLRDTKLYTHDFQRMLPFPTAHTTEIADAAVALLRERYRFQTPLRSATVAAFSLSEEDAPRQLDLLYDGESDERLCRLEDTLDRLREKYGMHSVCRASYYPLTDERADGALLHREERWNPAYSFGREQ